MRSSILIVLLCLAGCGKEPELEIKVPHPSTWQQAQGATVSGTCTCTTKKLGGVYTEVRTLTQSTCKTLQDAVITTCRPLGTSCTVSSGQCTSLYP